MDRFIRQRPGLEYGNYSSGWNDKEGRKAYFAECRSIARDLREARTLLAAVGWRESIDAKALKEAFRAYSGRLTVTVRAMTTKDGSPLWVAGLEYCTGQYWPTEYRKAVCAVLASALWDVQRASMSNDTVNGKSPGDRIREHFRREFGRAIQQRWFN